MKDEHGGEPAEEIGGGFGGQGGGEPGGTVRDRDQGYGDEGGKLGRSQDDEGEGEKGSESGGYGGAGGGSGD
ncbi:MAG: hypothetical protein ACR2IP_11160 [Solirubrobacteraceae bacterium]